MQMITPRPPGVNTPPDLVAFAFKAGNIAYHRCADGDMERIAKTQWRFQCARWTLYNQQHAWSVFRGGFQIGWQAGMREREANHAAR